MSKRSPRILLVHPWIADFKAYDFWIKPLGLLMIGRVLKDAGFETRLIDCLDRRHPALPRHLTTSLRTRPDGTGHFVKNPFPKPELLRAIPRKYGLYGLPVDVVKTLLSQEPRPDAILVTSGMTYWYPGVFAMIGLLRERFPGVPIALGGIYATLCHDHAVRHSGADVVVRGEGEAEVLRLLYDWTGYGQEALSNLESFPLPDYDLYPSLHTAAILTSRGCPFRCPVCASHLLVGRPQRMSPDRILSFLVYLARRGVRHVAFYDDALLVDREACFLPLLEGIVRLGLPLRFHTPNGLHPRWVDERVARWMARAGFDTIRLSYETADPVRQAAMGLKVCDEDLIRAVRCLTEAGVSRRAIGAYVLMGLPDQPLEEVVASARFVWRLGIRVSLAAFSPIPGTALWEEAVRCGRFSAEMDPILTNNALFPCRPPEIPLEAYVRLGSFVAEKNRELLAKGHISGLGWTRAPSSPDGVEWAKEEA